MAHLPGVLTGGVGPQRRDGALLHQVGGTTCGPTVLTVLAASTEPGWLDTGADGFADRFGAAQRRVHRQANRLWPRFLGTTPFGLLRWLRRYAPAAGRYRVAWVDDTSAADLTGACDAVTAAVRAGRPVPLMVGTWLPRHWVLAVDEAKRGWRVYEPSSGEVRVLDPDLLHGRRAGPVLGWPRLHAALLPVAPG
ncbi:hypothetical protein [Pseudonocardia sp. KRD291]|uniref:hypothetical protein n=1 Tax=Pseudonocardia sp. KRD291 TaxID=2792007 RepID=UPI001C4A04D5|nr:hypothetical protein [Pseudonocardia sp. KRD291]MBW0103368.1 hypothetical protein [Pseudonocardia sp. KRD291]